MSGGNIMCGGFEGSDKSGSAIAGVLDGMLKDAKKNDELVDIVEGLKSSMEEGEDHLLIDPELADVLLPAVNAYHKKLKAKLGDVDPFKVIELDEADGIDPLDAKWGKGQGWQYYCTSDLIEALKESKKTEEPVVIVFD